ncbi:hypothetical protein AMATHDRAFT_60362 [Amanita thiersii Skay4041]|uniref:Cytochrome P450 n=1 Tax=Amanita thiersii Skay4041 TaxID=703135 RepID=A0A2A9NJV4_9AGAR|nr:hypothetical protein AMATHDRAFT_60362 [Amanita thiersii Skay4041]
MGGFLLLLDFVMAACGVLLLRRLMNRRPVYPLPPGPRKLPLIGNLLDMPSEQEWLKFGEWARTWGDLVSVSVFGQQMIIINSAKTAVEMLEKKSRIYSDRPVLHMGGELVGWKDTLALLRYGPRLRNYRRLFHQTIGTHKAMSQFNHIEELETYRFLKRVLANPEGLAGHIRKATGAIILRISHGYEVEEGDDPFVAMADTATEHFSLSTNPGTFIVNVLPSLRHLPDWFPGAGFKQVAKEYRATLEEMVERPFQFVKQQMETGVAKPSFAAKLLENEACLTNDEIHDIKWSSASLYSAGADTTVSAIYGFFKAMVLNPDVQAKAQAEIDAVIGHDRLPTVEDRANLPYVSALVLETERWHSVVPTGLPHRVMENDIHDGYFIPKGASIITNIWGMTHDPEVYKVPMAFNPERFILTETHEPEPNPQDITFGFGRRICPGRLLADTSIYMACAMSLAVFDITPHIENGKAIMPNMEQSTGTISHPSEFKCTIVPRSRKALALISADESLGHI